MNSLYATRAKTRSAKARLVSTSTRATTRVSDPALPIDSGLLHTLVAAVSTAVDERLDARDHLPLMPLLPTPLSYRLPHLWGLPRPGRRLLVNGSASLQVRGRRRQAGRCPRAASPPNVLRPGPSRGIVRCRPSPSARHVCWSTMSAGITTSVLLRIARWYRPAALQVRLSPPDMACWARGYVTL